MIVKKELKAKQMNDLRSKIKFHDLKANRFDVKISEASGSYSRAKAIERISTGSKSLDDILGGGIETKALTEFYGESGSGKTQICHTLSVMAAQDKSNGGVNAKIIYIDTQGKFRPERIVAIAKSRGFNIDHAMSNILCVKTMNAHRQESIIENILSRLNNDSSIRLLIVDSVISNYRAEFSKVQKQKKLYKFMCTLANIAQRYNIAVVVTNQVNFLSHYRTANPSGGKIMAHASTYRISLRRLHNNSKQKSILKESGGHFILS
jgi:DNA repair protein RadA